MRNLLIGGAALVAVILAVVGYLNSDQSVSEPTGSVSDAADVGSSDELDALSVAGPMGDIAMGSPDAPVTIYEYASLTCSHCAAFHSESFPQLKEKYIDTGKVRLIVRAFPFDPAATAAVMLARCAGEDRYYKFVDVLFDQQPHWAFTGDPGANLEAIAKQGGFSSDAYKACIQNKDIFDHVRAVQSRAQEVLGVNSTPTFFINGEKVEGAVPFDEFEEVLLKHLPES